MQPFTVYWYFIFVLFLPLVPPIRLVPLVMLITKLIPHIKNFKICQTTIITWTPLSGSIWQVFNTQSLFQTIQIANEIRPKQHGISQLQTLQYTTAQISLLLPTFTTHNMLVFVDMLHSFELGFALHLCKKQEWTYKNKNLYRTSNSSQWGIQ